MGIPNKQIGWSTESNLIWNALKELDKLNKVTGSSLSSIIASLATKITNEKGVPSFYADTMGNIPPAGTVGRMFVSTNTFAIYRDNGISWDLIGGPGTGVITGGGTTGRYAIFSGTSAISNGSLTESLTKVSSTKEFEATKLITTGGLSSQFVKGDGTLDSTSYQPLLTNPITGTGVSNELAYFTGTTTLGSLSTTTYPSLTEISYVKGVTSDIQTQLNSKQNILTNPVTGTGTAGQVSFWTGTTTQSGSLNFLWDNTNNRLRLGGGSDGGQTFQVTGNSLFSPLANTTGITLSGYSLTGASAVPALDISGTWNTSGTPTLIRANVTDTASNASSLLFDFQVGGVSRISMNKNSNIFLRGGSVIRPSDGTDNNATGVNNGINFRSAIQTNTSNVSDFIFTNFQGDSTITSGTRNLILLSRGFAPTSGTGNYSHLVLSTTINQTGGANGITRGLLIAPTLTSAADWRSIEWSNNTGRGLWGVGTADNAIAGALHIGSATNANASAILELTSTTRGVLFPRMTGSQAEAIVTPADGLVVYINNGNGTTITSTGFWGRDNGVWTKLN